eukprot:g2327.t1
MNKALIAFGTESAAFLDEYAWFQSNRIDPLILDENTLENENEVLDTDESVLPSQRLGNTKIYPFSTTKEMEESHSMLSSSLLLAIVKIMFEDLDRDDTGSLKKQQVRVVLEDILDDPIEDEDFDELFTQMDENSDGLLSYNEFMSSLPVFPKSSRLAELAFDSIDCDEGDSITVQEVLEAMADLDVEGSVKSSVETLFAGLCQNDDGTITFGEFRSAFEDLLDTMREDCEISKVKREVPQCLDADEIREDEKRRIESETRYSSATEVSKLEKDDSAATPAKGGGGATGVML